MLGIVPFEKLSIYQFFNFPKKVHCEWGEWVVGECSTTCGEGMRTDVREQVVSAKNGGIECEGEASITEICHAGVDCPPRKIFFITD